MISAGGQILLNCSADLFGWLELVSCCPLLSFSNHQNTLQLCLPALAYPQVTSGDPGQASFVASWQALLPTSFLFFLSINSGKLAFFKFDFFHSFFQILENF